MTSHRINIHETRFQWFSVTVSYEGSHIIFAIRSALTQRQTQDDACDFCDLVQDLFESVFVNCLVAVSETHLVITWYMPIFGFDAGRHNWRVNAELNRGEISNQTAKRNI